MATLLRAGAAPDVVVYISTNRLVSNAERVATSIFADAGISVTWHRGDPAKGASGSIVIPVTLSEQTPEDCPLDILAQSHPYAAADKGITVFYKKVRELAANSLPEQLLLGHVLAHEIGHVLEGVDRHSQEGVMKARWSQKDFEEMQKAPLRFGPEDTDLLIYGLAARRQNAAPVMDAGRKNAAHGFVKGTGGRRLFTHSGAP
jgi:hypothetical protein